MWLNFHTFRVNPGVLFISLFFKTETFVLRSGPSENPWERRHSLSHLTSVYLFDIGGKGNLWKQRVRRRVRSGHRPLADLTKPGVVEPKFCDLALCISFLSSTFHKKLRAGKKIVKRFIAATGKKKKGDLPASLMSNSINGLQGMSSCSYFCRRKTLVVPGLGKLPHFRVYSLQSGNEVFGTGIKTW